MRRDSDLEKQMDLRKVKLMLMEIDSVRKMD